MQGESSSEQNESSSSAKLGSNVQGIVSEKLAEDHPGIQWERKKKRKRLTGRQYQLVRDVLWLQQGEKCYYHFAKCTNTKDVIAHIDHNPLNWKAANIAVSCRYCNASISSEGVVAKSGMVSPVSVSEKKRELAEDANLVAMSDRMQADLDNWLMQRLGPGGAHHYLPLKFIAREAGYDCRISGPTIYRYLDNPGTMVASNSRWRLVERHMYGDRPGKLTKCITWRGRPMDQELMDDLYITERERFVKGLDKAKN